ncbi:leucine-rich repeat domain-containing protein [Mariniflexile sp. AS56]|uniref:leucine-rich repeat domain-containing protein n=1 Tax=Mariniflexile sp. AS56 TaxID=3063957 RepID=UPI0026F2E2C9|nr:leucine-rich repeat domain-containing protein [Mariniflexile sp. AS56]MDO7173699.1 T9SS type A sorting domain-containing protein [Mariniflexile sp. AS56]
MLKKYISLVLFFLFFVNNVTSQTITIPDPNFEQALIDLGIDSDGIINQTLLYSDAQPVVSLDLSNRNISDLTGISYFFNLTSLNCSNNNITSFYYTGSLTNLRSLSLSGNEITTLTLYDNSKLNSVDVSNNPNLTYLNAKVSRIWGGLVLNASNNPNLITLSCVGSALKEININQNTSLEDLILSQNDLTSIDLSTNVNLKNLDLSFNKFTTFEIHNTQLTSLKIDGNNLVNLDCSNNQITSLEVNRNTIVSLNCSNNKFSSFNDYPSNTLTSLDLSYNDITDLTINVNGLSALNIAYNPLVSLQIENTNLSSFDISTNTKLVTLNLFSCPITSVNLTQNTDLVTLAIYNTLLKSIDASQNTKLVRLYTGNNNELTSLDLRNGNNSLMTATYITTHPLLTCVFVDNAILANTRQAPYTNWEKDISAVYRQESCDFNIVISIDKTTLLENGEQAIITATLNEVNPTEDVTINLVASGTASITNYTLSSNTIIIPSGELTGTATITANEEDMDSDKTVIIDIDSVEKADELTEQQLTITITHINNAPTDIALSNLIIDENSIIGTEIGIFTSTDVDSEDDYTYTLVSGDGDNDNSSFTITDDKLLSGKVFDFETKNSYSIRVQTDDGNGGTFSKSFTVSITDLNTLFIEDSNASIRFKNDIVLKLESSETIKGFQFDITFPGGFVFNPLDITNIGLPGNYQVSSSNVGGNTFRVIGFSLTNETIAAGTISIIKFPTFINEGTPTGEYPIPVFNVTLSDVNNVDIATLSPTDGIVTVYSHPRGDANGDNIVNILDILGVIDYIFGNPPSVFNFELVDINSDDSINILDVLAIQDIILNPIAKKIDNGTKVNTAKKLAGNNYLNIINDMFSPNTSEIIEINLENDDIVKGVQFDFVLPEGFTLNAADIVGSSRLNGFNISAQETSANTYKVLIFSFSSATIAPGTGAILKLPVFIEPEVSIGVYPIEPTDVIISDTNNTDKSTQAPNVGKITINTLSLNDAEDQDNILTLYPNPAMETLYVKTNRKSRYSIIDVYGKLVITGKLEQGENKLDLKNYQTGIYFLQIKNELGFVTKKVIKE